jgi:DNA-binding HxlR family transcriptional regulator
MVEAGMLECRSFSAKPLRREYLLSARGRDYRPAPPALNAFGETHYPDGRTPRVGIFWRGLLHPPAGVTF